MTDARPIGIFGGTFDPPHIGHLILAAEAQAQLQLSEILFVLTADPPHKQDRQITPLEHRLAMLQAALENQPDFQISRVELDRPGPYYALDTIALLRKQYPDQKLVYLIGGDSFRDLPTWHKAAELIDQIDKLGVMRRPFAKMPVESLVKQIPALKEKLEFIDSPLLEIASREIRKRIREGGHYRYFLPPAVHQYIEDKHPYT